MPRRAPGSPTPPAAAAQGGATVAGSPAGCPGSPVRVETPGDSNAPKTLPIFSQNQAAFDPGSEWAAPALLACRLLGSFPYAASADCGDEARKPLQEQSSRDRETGATCQQVVQKGSPQATFRQDVPIGHLGAGGVGCLESPPPRGGQGSRPGVLTTLLWREPFPLMAGEMFGEGWGAWDYGDNFLLIPTLTG